MISKKDYLKEDFNIISEKREKLIKRINNSLQSFEESLYNANNLYYINKIVKNYYKRTRKYLSNFKKNVLNVYDDITDKFDKKSEFFIPDEKDFFHDTIEVDIKDDELERFEKEIEEKKIQREKTKTKFEQEMEDFLFSKK